MKKYVLLIIFIIMLPFVVRAEDINNDVLETNGQNNRLTITKNGLDNFDLEFLKLENKEKNKIYSPLSIKYALGMLMTGASGESQKQISDIVGNYKFQKFKNSKNMSFANALFIKNSFKDSIKKSFTEQLKNQFDAEVKYDSFKKPDALNKYVSEKTFNLINNIFDDVSNNDFVLINALAIDMEWVNKIQAYENNYYVSFSHMNYHYLLESLDNTDFHELVFNGDKKNKKQSVEIAAVINNYDIVKVLGKDKIKSIVKKDHDKWVKNGAEDACQLENGKPDTSFDYDNYIKELDENYGDTSSSTDFEFYVDDSIKVFKKDLKKYDDTKLTYVGIMPKKEKLSDFINRVDAEYIDSLINSTKSIKKENFKEGVITQITGYVPIFNFDYSLSFMDDLKKIGITDVFDINKADLSNITTTKSVIGSAGHKATIDFSNDGIKAAAASYMGGYGAGDCGYDYFFVPPVEKIDVTFDKPYMFLIMDRSTGNVWFVGTVYSPSKYEPFHTLYASIFERDDDDDYDDDDYDDDYDYEDDDDYDDDESNTESNDDSIIVKPKETPVKNIYLERIKENIKNLKYCFIAVIAIVGILLFSIIKRKKIKKENK